MIHETQRTSAVSVFDQGKRRVGDLRSPPKEASVVAPVPRSRIDHVWSQDIDNNSSNVVGCTTKCDSLDL